MSDQRKRGLRIFVQYEFLFLLMAAVNVYAYRRGGNVLSLVLAVLAGLIGVGWALFYWYYVRGKE